MTMSPKEAANILSRVYRPPLLDKGTSEALDLAIAVLSDEPHVSPARHSDPETSKRAYEGIKAGSAREKVLLAFESTPQPCMMSARGACIAAGIDKMSSPWKRVSELKEAGFLCVLGTTIDPLTNREVEVYDITTKGRAAVKALRGELRHELG